MSTVHGLKQKMKAGEVVLALRPPITYTKSQLETALGKGSYDLIYIDGQHTAFSDDQLVSICGAAEELGMPVQFRIPHTRNTYLIGRYLDMGLSAILVPETVKPETVEEAVGYSYYSPIGYRSWGGGARFGTKRDGKTLGRSEYVPFWNEHVVLGVQIESVEAVENVRSLIKPGLDYFAFGPNDLSFDLEQHPEYRFRTTDDCTKYVVEQLQGTGVPCGMAIVTEPEERQKYIDMGLTMFQENPRR